ncbi:MAG: sulfotransferase [Flavobacteriales bacterium]|nr:sulfotransferase [Flavobacteriales bacterium]NNK80541.1 sulfotransferase [Flavobacteriales bacterium]
MRPLLILGCQRSGTTLLASMLGRHSEVNMLFESTSSDTLKLIGKKYQGNKLCTWRQIRMNERSSRWGHIMNRIVNLGIPSDGYQIKRYAPTSKLSINDYLEKDAIIIVIRRDKAEIISSLMNRTPMNEKQAKREFDLADSILDEISEKATEVNFKNLVNDPEGQMRLLCPILGIEFEEKMLEGPAYNIIYPQSGFDKKRASS